MAKSFENKIDSVNKDIEETKRAIEENKKSQLLMIDILIAAGAPKEKIEELKKLILSDEAESSNTTSPIPNEKLTTEDINSTISEQGDNVSLGGLNNFNNDLGDNNMMENNGQQNEIINNDSNLENSNLSVFLDPDNKGIWDKVSNGAKNMMNSAYEGIHKVPVVNRAVAKMEIAYSQFWIDKKEEKSIKLKSKMDSLSFKDQALDTSRQEMEVLAKDLDSQGIPGSASLFLKIKEIQEQKDKIANKKDKLQSKIEIKENKINLYTNKRDGIADRLINHYDKKLSPIEGKLDVLQSKRDFLDLKITATEIKHEEQKVRLNEIKDKKLKIEEALRKSGESERNIKNSGAIKELNKLIEDGYKRIEKDNLELSYKKDSFDKKVAKVDQKAQPYRNRKDEFIRVKNNRPVKIDLEKRETAKEFKDKEDTSANTRLENSESHTINDNSSSTQREGDSYFTLEGGINLVDCINSYNKYLNNYKDIDNLTITKNFLIETGLSSNTNITLINFKKIIEKYYKVKKIPQGLDLKNLINNFN